MNIIKPKLFVITLFLLIISAFVTFIFIPQPFKIQGGSCYQGIAVFFTNIIMIFCLMMLSISFFLAFIGRNKIALIISYFSLFCWIFWAFVSSTKYPMQGLLYFSFFSFANFLSIFYLIKAKEVRNQKE
ncbi:hypothetical protein QX233_16565 [Chryseobacterium gambrini]|uniref:Uncharacterized protein n=1 Tax=Chryseobacterium gambrini TaxID=373672 RepID=A0AAJ1R534_9FLAO|nr:MULTISPECIES: hypothetical protein [Chryseobacterium]MDN4014085.1 hypothetical protein [Chryseobacterium gambrini]MDN4028138.1 hypothetical protein [Chryseobacterium gambrini]QWA39852.1 hypothetical protein KKI44_06490 [Chryseobacterium sp. ZHDP1]